MSVAQCLKKMTNSDGADLKGFFAAMAEQAAYDYYACYKAHKAGKIVITKDNEKLIVVRELKAARAYLEDRFKAHPEIFRLIESGKLPKRRSVHQQEKPRARDNTGTVYSRANPKKGKRK